MVQHLEHLLFYGADMNARNASGNTPLHVCAVNNQVSSSTHISLNISVLCHWQTIKTNKSRSNYRIVVLECYCLEELTKNVSISLGRQLTRYEE